MPDKPPANWPFPTWKGQPLPKVRRVRRPAPDAPLAPF